MKTNLRKFVVYDLETGGLRSQASSITEFAAVVVDAEILEIEDKFSVMIRPYLDLSFINEDPKKEAKSIFQELAVEDPDSSMKIVKMGDVIVAPKTTNLFIEPIKNLQKFLKKRSKFFSYEDFLQSKEENPDLVDILDIYFDMCYNPQALEATHISIDMLLKEGVEYADAFKQIRQIFLDAVVENYKPIVVGHNIKSFDNAFMEKLFKDNKLDFYKHINKVVEDTLDWAHLRWSELQKYTLSACCAECNIILEGAHRAINDTIANALFWINTVESLRGKGVQKTKRARRKFKLNI